LTRYIALITAIINMNHLLQSLVQRSFVNNPGNPVLNDSHLKAEKVIGGLSLPTTMAFVGNNDILVLEKAKGTVERIVNGKLLSKPLLKVNVESRVERGMLGIAVANNKTSPRHVFLYFTEKTNLSMNHISDSTSQIAYTDTSLLMVGLLIRSSFWIC
jgi:glucose/arabinose dehydrogenase